MRITATVVEDGGSTVVAVDVSLMSVVMFFTKLHSITDFFPPLPTVAVRFTCVATVLAIRRGGFELERLLVPKWSYNLFLYFFLARPKIERGAVCTEIVID